MDDYDYPTVDGGLAEDAEGHQPPHSQMLFFFRLLLPLVLALGLFVLTQPAWSAPAPLRFEQLGAELGLPQSSVTDMLQDSDGFMWFAGQGGLSRYDGYRFNTYRNDPADPHSMVDNSVQALHQDNEGQMWVGTLQPA